ncbi:GntR family transcriptional regulator [Hoeflea alexandrii]|uniref:GntR family transcriptional regulator n=1 Tax=Hoeflea alexandrii TaxID=288436 RepID=UPI0022AFC3DC|nr:GntR family transcriptional regulator [Hoeflea alexandrii]MCZ4291304.1 GntR family transcriptional regulator [Hoeflea alexandrii]
MPALQPLDDFPGSLSQKVYMSLKQAILSLAFRPGELMQKSEICKQLGVSRSPVTEAMARLASEGLADIVPQAGTYVTRFSMAEIREGAFLREALELAAVEAVAATITEEQLVSLKRNLRIQEALMEDGDTAGFHQMDAELHEMILSFTGYRRLASLAETAWIHVNRARQLNLPMPGRMQATLEEHKAIVAALEARDPEAARKATRHHLSQLILLLEPLVIERPELFTSG